MKVLEPPCYSSDFGEQLVIVNRYGNELHAASGVSGVHHIASNNGKRDVTEVWDKKPHVV